MCFSAEASFTAAAVLGVMGATTLKNCSSKTQFFLAAIPFLFAIQQLSEGFLWMQLNNHLGLLGNSKYAQQTFLTFAFLIWPVWVPLSLALIEKTQWRRRLIFIDLGCGVVLSYLNFTASLKQDISVQIINHSIQYLGHAPSQALIYPFIILFPCFISSLKNMWIFGFFVLFAYLVADYYYTATFVSVWCFFSAIVSGLIYKVIKDNQADYEKNTRSTQE